MSARVVGMTPFKEGVLGASAAGSNWQTGGFPTGVLCFTVSVCSLHHHDLYL